MSSRRKGVRTCPNLSLTSLSELRDKPCTRRVLLSVCNSIYDPLGLATPYTIKLKLLMKATLEQGSSTDWNTPLNEGMNEEWLQTIEEGIAQGYLQFYRSVLP